MGKRVEALVEDRLEPSLAAADRAAGRKLGVEVAIAYALGEETAVV